MKAHWLVMVMFLIVRRANMDNLTRDLQIKRMVDDMNFNTEKFIETIGNLDKRLMELEKRIIVLENKRKIEEQIRDISEPLIKEILGKRRENKNGKTKKR